MDVSDRRMQVQLTQEARIASDFSYIRAILAVVGFVSALRPPAWGGLSPYPNSFAAFSMRLATGTPKGQRSSQPLQPTQSPALAESCW